MAVATQFPTANEFVVGTPWTDPNNAHADDGLLTTQSGDGEHRWLTFGFDSVIPSGATINAVKVICEHNDDDPPETLLSIPYVDGVGQALRPYPQRSVMTVDINDHTEDRTWTRANLLDASFKVSLAPQLPASLKQVDYLKVEVTYTAGTTLKFLGDPVHDVRGWWDPLLTSPGWFDQELIAAAAAPPPSGPPIGTLALLGVGR